jgi:hypothetical protein
MGVIYARPFSCVNLNIKTGELKIMESSIHRVNSITISKRDLTDFGIVEVEVTTTDGEKLFLKCFHDADKPITMEVE